MVSSIIKHRVEIGRSRPTIVVICSNSGRWAVVSGVPHGILNAEPYPTETFPNNVSYSYSELHTHTHTLLTALTLLPCHTLSGDGGSEFLTVTTTLRVLLPLSRFYFYLGYWLLEFRCLFFFVLKICSFMSRYSV